MKMADYGNIIVIKSATDIKEFHLPGQRVEGLNYLFEILQNASLEQDSLGYVENDVSIEICRHGIVKMSSDIERILTTNWVEKIFTALSD